MVFGSRAVIVLRLTGGVIEIGGVVTAGNTGLEMPGRCATGLFRRLRDCTGDAPLEEARPFGEVRTTITNEGTN